MRGFSGGAEKEVFGSFSVAQIVRRPASWSQHVLLASFLEKSVKCAAECVQMFPLSSSSSSSSSRDSARQHGASPACCLTAGPRGLRMKKIHKRKDRWKIGRQKEREKLPVRKRHNVKFSPDSAGPAGPERVARVLLQQLRLLRLVRLRRLRKWKTCSATRPTTLIARAAAAAVIIVKCKIWNAKWKM